MWCAYYPSPIDAQLAVIPTACYPQRMRSAYIGLVSQHGLETLLPENPATRRWSLAQCQTFLGACIWAVIDQESADELQTLLTEGERRAALSGLTSVAAAVGPLV